MGLAMPGFLDESPKQASLVLSEPTTHLLRFDSARLSHSQS